MAKPGDRFTLNHKEDHPCFGWEYELVEPVDTAFSLNNDRMEPGWRIIAVGRDNPTPIDDYPVNYLDVPMESLMRIGAGHLFEDSH